MISRRRALLAGLVLAAPGLGRTEDAFNPSQVMVEQGLYLPRLRELEAAVAASPDRRQTLAQFKATLGDEAGAYADWMAMRTSGPAPADETDYSAYTAAPALEVIATAARGHRVVVLNEAHFASRCRAFAAAVARRLRADGFDMLLAEDFAAAPSARFAARIAAGDPYTTDLGYYGQAPVYAELVRQARADGYRLEPYEQTPDQKAPRDADGPAKVAARETAQAQNIATILSSNPTSRLLVYCGHSHLAEAPLGPYTWMAARLKALTGLDPLTIDQSLGLPAPEGAFELPTVTAVLAHFNPVAPIIVRRPDGASLALGSYDGTVDLTVFHPRSAEVEGRPGWLTIAPDRRRTAFMLAEPAPAGALLQAVPDAEARAAPNVVPADQYPLKSATSKAIFFLRPGAYEVRLETDAGRRVLGALRVA